MQGGVTFLDGDVVDGGHHVDGSHGRRLASGVGSVTFVGAVFFFGEWRDLTYETLISTNEEKHNVNSDPQRAAGTNSQSRLLALRGHWQAKCDRLDLWFEFLARFGMNSAALIIIIIIISFVFLCFLFALLTSTQPVTSCFSGPPLVWMAKLSLSPGRSSSFLFPLRT